MGLEQMHELGLAFTAKRGTHIDLGIQKTLITESIRLDSRRLIRVELRICDRVPRNRKQTSIGHEAREEPRRL